MLEVGENMYLTAAVARCYGVPWSPLSSQRKTKAFRFYINKIIFSAISVSSREQRERARYSFLFWLLFYAGMGALGRVKVNVLLSLRILVAEILPPWAWIIARVQLSPRPLPGSDRLRSHR